MNYGLEESDFLKLLGDHGEGVLGEGMPKDNVKGSPKIHKGSPKSSPKTLKDSPKHIGKTAQAILDMVLSDPLVTVEQMSGNLGISSRMVKKHLKNLQTKGIVVRVGANRGGFWKVQNPNKDE